MRIIVMPGDGIGPEITAATVDVLKRASERFALGLSFEEHDVGFASLARNGVTITPGLLERCREADGLLLGPVSHSDYPPRAEGGINVSSELRVRLDLYANIRPSRSRDGLPHWGRRWTRCAQATRDDTMRSSPMRPRASATSTPSCSRTFRRHARCRSCRLALACPCSRPPTPP